MKKVYFAVLTFVLAICMAVGLAACTPDEGGSNVTIQLNKTELTLVEGESERLTATTSDGSTVTWSSSDEDVASVNSRGNVTAQGEGTATITAKSGEATATCSVTVEAKQVITISGLQETATVERFKTVQLSATASDNSAIEWSSSNTRVATVDENGLVAGVMAGEATIYAVTESGGRATCELTVTYNNAPEGWYEMQLYGQNKTPVREWGYWADQPAWNGSNVDVISAEYLGDNADSMAGSIMFTYEYTVVTDFIPGMQITYRDPDIVKKGGFYKLTCTIDTTAGGVVTIIGTEVTLEEGENEVTVYFQSDDDGHIYDDTDYTNLNSAFYMYMGSSSAGTVIEEATVTISNLKWEEFAPDKLATPTLALDGKNVTITDTNEAASVAGYQLGLFVNADDDMPEYSQTLTEKTGTIDDSMMLGGEYILKVRALAVDAGSADSDWSEGVAFTVEEHDISYELANTTEAELVPNTWAFWSEYNSMTGTYTNGDITLNSTDAGGNWYSCQVFLKNTNLIAGNQYVFTATLTSTVAGTITINGNHVTLEANVPKDVEIVISGGANFSMQWGTSDGTSAFGQNAVEFKMEGIQFSLLVPEQLVAPSFTIEEKVVTIEDTNTEGVGSYEIGFFQGEELKGTVAITDGGTIDDAKIVDGEYTLKIRAVAASGLYISSDWSEGEVAYTVANGGVSYTLENAGSEGAKADPGVWYIYSTTGSTATYEDGTVTFNLVANATPFYSNQIFLHDASINGTGYHVSFKINASVGGTITICGTVYTLVEGENVFDFDKTDVYSNGDPTITILFGKWADGDIGVVDITEGTFVITEVTYGPAESAEEA